MNTVLMKYECDGAGYLICDTSKSSLDLNEKVIRMLCGRNFGAACRGVIAGTAGADGSADMRTYSPDGTELQGDEGAKSAFLRYLSDEGYTGDAVSSKEEDVYCTGKVFVMDELIRKMIG